jgi:hypothetical protein
MSEFIIGNRFFESNAEKAEESVKNLRGFIENSLDAGASGVIVAINSVADRSNALGLRQEFDPAKVQLVAVQPWHAFINPLNSIILEAKNLCERYDRPSSNTNLVFASTEVRIKTDDKGNALDVFQRYMNRGNVLCVGASFPEHNFQPGYYANATGAQIPWNTLACYNLDERVCNGYDPIGDGVPGDPKTKGVEELASLAKAQALINYYVNRGYEAENSELLALTVLMREEENLDLDGLRNASASFKQLVEDQKLTKGRIFLTNELGYKIDTSGMDEDRLIKQAEKMTSKALRPEMQMKFIARILGVARESLGGPSVVHI